MTEHVTDDLELYAVGALRPREAERVAAHLAECPVCREELAEIATAVNALPDMVLLRELRAAETERAEYASIAAKVSHGGTNWYMVGLDQWQGSGGTLFAPQKADISPFVVFHDLRPLTGGAMYTVWLVDADGHWVRGANFTPNGEGIQSVDLTVPVDSFAQCAVTIEMQSEGKRSGPLVMQSRIAPPGQ